VETRAARRTTRFTPPNKLPALSPRKQTPGFSISSCQRQAGPDTPSTNQVERKPNSTSVGKDLKSLLRDSIQSTNILTSYSSFLRCIESITERGRQGPVRGVEDPGLLFCCRPSKNDLSTGNTIGPPCRMRKTGFLRQSESGKTLQLREGLVPRLGVLGDSCESLNQAPGDSEK
jgi:hypothetical protein